MQKVFDSNFLRSDGLREYLGASKKNFVVIIDYVAMEAYKRNPITTMYESMTVLADFPRQVIVLKGTAKVCMLRGRPSGLLRRMIDQKQTRRFPQFIKHLNAAKGGDAAFQKAAGDHGAEAATHMEKLLKDASGLPEVFEEAQENYTESELRIIRKGLPYTEDIIDTHVRTVLQLAAALFRDHPLVTKFPIGREFTNTLIFRVALGMHILMMRWIAAGGAKGVKPERIRNDLVDVFYAAYATFFDGLLTNDKKLVIIYEEAAFLLKELFVPIMTEEGRK